MVCLNVHYRGVLLPFYWAVWSSLLGQLRGSLRLSSDSKRTHFCLGPHVCNWCVLSCAKVFGRSSVSVLQWNLRRVLPQEFVWLVFRASLGLNLFMQIARKFVQSFVGIISSFMCCRTTINAWLEWIQLLLDTRLPYFLREVWNVEDRFLALIRFYAFHWSGSRCGRIVLVVRCRVWISVQASALIQGSFAHVEMLRASIVLNGNARHRSWFAQTSLLFKFKHCFCILSFDHLPGSRASVNLNFGLYFVIKTHDILIL